MLAQLTKEPAAPDSLFGWTFAPVLFAGIPLSISGLVLLFVISFSL
jgi:hypothetical protein